MVTDNTVKQVTKLKNTSLTVKINKSTWQKYLPRARDLYIRDSQLSGYYIRIRPNGKRTYCCEARLGGAGRKKSLTIGDCNLYTQEQARDVAIKWLQKIKQGSDPKRELRRQSSKNKTLIDFAHSYIAFNKNLAPSTTSDYPKRIKNCMPQLAKKPITEIDQQDVLDWWMKCNGSRNNIIAFGYARKCLKIAKVQGYINRNPFDDAKDLIGQFKTPEAKKTHVPQNKLREFMRGMDDTLRLLHPPVMDLILFLFLTGKRIGEARSIQWSDIDWEKGVITLRHTKNKKVDYVPLTLFLFQMFKNRKDRPTVGSYHPQWVFPNKKNSGHIIDIRKSLKKINEAANIGINLTPHDFRRTFSTACKEIGFYNEDIGNLLNHSNKSVTEGYIIRNIKTKRNMLEHVHTYYDEHGENFFGSVGAEFYETTAFWKEEKLKYPNRTEDKFDKEAERDLDNLVETQTVEEVEYFISGKHLKK